MLREQLIACWRAQEGFPAERLSSWVIKEEHFSRWDLICGREGGFLPDNGLKTLLMDLRILSCPDPLCLLPQPLCLWPTLRSWQQTVCGMWRRKRRKGWRKMQTCWCVCRRAGVQGLWSRLCGRPGVCPVCPDGEGVPCPSWACFDDYTA